MRIVDNQMSQSKKKKENKIRLSPFTRIKASKEEASLKEKLSPKMTTAASKYVKNANRLQSSSISLSKKHNNS